ncbi:MAG: alpha-amylase family glycosyl hydrolase [Isosphaeraceae bacterium]
MNNLPFPTLYEVNTRVWLGEIARRSGKKGATLDDVSEEELDKIVGFDWVWLLGIWQTGAIGRELSQTRPEWRREFEAILPDLTDDDICGSPFAVRAYDVHTDFGGETVLRRFRNRLRERGAKLMLDFVPNHTALDHDWVGHHPEFYIQGNEDDLIREPHNYVRLSNPNGNSIFAYGRDPYFSGWLDTLQLNYRHPSFRHAMKRELGRIADLCDGVRCDMAMLVLPEIFQRTWGDRSLPRDGFRPVDAPFWIEAIAQVRDTHREFLFMAEAYWNLEWELQQQGFDYTYDKTMYDRLRSQDAPSVREHLKADFGYQSKSVRFLENHDEERAAREFPGDVKRAAAVCSYFVPGMRFFHDGQFEGRKVRVPVHLARRPEELIDSSLKEFYGRILECLKRPEVRAGHWRSIECREAWSGNPTWERFLAWTWEANESTRLLVAVNLGSTQGQCRLNLESIVDFGSGSVHLRELFSLTEYVRDGEEIGRSGLFVDLPAWGCHVFEILK